MAPGFDRGFDVFEAGFHPKHSADEGRYERSSDVRAMWCSARSSG